jgi:hypothetical protein
MFVIAEYYGRVTTQTCAGYGLQGFEGSFARTPKFEAPTKLLTGATNANEHNRQLTLTEAYYLMRF